jgi:CheY-like chemotaxis protein
VPASHESPAGTASSVLLVEEYDALAAAITSALKKFAPRHRTNAVESLAQAEAVAIETGPQLIIVDFDPPRSDTIEFLHRISATNPDARFLAIASGVPVEFAAERYGPNAIQFVEKPFELAEFGAAVQALLGPWTNVASGDSRGTLRDLNARDLVPLQCLNVASSQGRHPFSRWPNHSCRRGKFQRHRRIAPNAALEKFACERNRTRRRCSANHSWAVAANFSGWAASNESASAGAGRSIGFSRSAGTAEAAGEERQEDCRDRRYGNAAHFRRRRALHG